MAAAASAAADGGGGGGSNHTLVYRSADVDELEKALQTAHDALVKDTGDLITGADKQLSGWDAKSDSRIAQQDYAKRLAKSIEDFAKSLLDIKSAVHQVGEKGRQAELESYVIMQKD